MVGKHQARSLVMTRFLFIAISVLSVPGCMRTVNQHPCGHFFRALKAVPNESLTQSTGEYRSLWNGAKHVGCEVKLVTNDTLNRNHHPMPNFDAQPDSELYRHGWRTNNAYTADGPGSSVYGIEKEKTLCVVREDQPAHIDDRGSIVQSETLTITVQCRNIQD